MARPDRQLGLNIRCARVRAGMRLEQVASSTGKSISTLSRIENGLRGATDDELADIAAAIGCGTDEFLPETAIAA